MLVTRFFLWIFSVSAAILGAGALCAQDYPTKPIRIVTALAGGGGDLVARLIGQGLAGSMRQPVIVDNRGAIMAAEIVAKAAPDGYTLLSYGTTVWLLPFMRDYVPWDPVKSFVPISLTVSTPNVLVVNSSVPVQSVKELIALAKARPGELNYASSGTGASNHLAGELFKAMAGVNIVRIPYKGNAAAVNDLLGARVQIMFVTPAAVMPHAKTGKLRTLAVSSAQPSPLTPGLPTVAASGLPGYESVLPYGIFVPAKTPSAVVGRLHQEIVRFLNRTEVREQFLNAGFATVASSPQEFAAAIKSEMERMSKVIKDAGIRDE